MARARPAPTHPTMDDLLDDPAVSHPLKAVLIVWRSRDPVDAAHDADLLAGVMGRRADTLTGARHGA